MSKKEFFIIVILSVFATLAVLGGSTAIYFWHDALEAKKINEQLREAFEDWSEEGIKGNVTRLVSENINATGGEYEKLFWNSANNTIPHAYIYNRVVLRLTLTNGTHFIQSVLLFNEETNEITDEIEHFLIKITNGRFELLGIYQQLIEVPNYESFLQVLEESKNA